MTGRVRLDDLTSDKYDALCDELEAYRNAPVLRDCLIPGCLRQFDTAAWMDSRRPLVRPEWSGDGWKQIRPTVASGYVCPDHASLLAQHRHRWDTDLPEGRSLLRCACGWVSMAVRWPGAAVAAWQDHLIQAQEAATAKETGR